MLSRTEGSPVSPQYSSARGCGSFGGGQHHGSRPNSHAANSSIIHIYIVYTKSRKLARFAVTNLLFIQYTQ